MTTKVKTTVEKWEFDVADYVHQGNYDDDLPIYGIEEANKAVKDLVSRSVQEAKAEMIAKIEGMKYTYPEKDSGWTTRNGKAKLDTVSYNAALEDLIASLKQEEDKV